MKRIEECVKQIRVEVRMASKVMGETIVYPSEDLSETLRVVGPMDLTSSLQKELEFAHNEI